MIYKMEHPTIEFSSSNERLVGYYQSRLEGITATELLSGRLDGTHHFMISMCCAGNFPLFDIYIKQWKINKTNAIKTMKEVSIDA